MKIKHAEIFNAYSVLAHSGHGYSLCGTYTSAVIAREAAKDKGEWGGDGSIKPAKVLQVHYEDGTKEFFSLGDKVDLDDRKKQADERLRRETLLGLSADQIRVLGLQDK